MSQTRNFFRGSLNHGIASRCPDSVVKSKFLSVKALYCEQIMLLTLKGLNKEKDLVSPNVHKLVWHFIVLCVNALFTQGVLNYDGHKNIKSVCN